MLGHKVREFKPLTGICLEDLVPADNFYRQVERSLDLSFVRELAAEFYSNIGRTSIDPVVFFKLQLIAFFEGIRSERKLMETVNLNLAHRWFIGYDLHEPVPDHSSLSKIRERFGMEVFQLFFERIVEMCIQAGLVWGEELYIDSTKVQANANVSEMIDRGNYEARQHLDQLFEETLSPFGRLVAKYNGERISGIRKPHYQRTTDDRVSPIDPDATPMQSSGRGGAKLGYRDHYVVDGGKARIILSALVTPASITDNTPLLDLVDWVLSRWKIAPKLAVGDTRYGTVPNKEVVSRAIELAEGFGGRVKGSVEAIKRSVYFGGSMSLEEGLRVEHIEFLGVAKSKDGQELMVDYLKSTDTSGELPFYDSEAYGKGIKTGRMPKH